MVGRTEATRAVDVRLRVKYNRGSPSDLMFAPCRRRYLAAPGDVLHAPLLNVDPDGTSVREPLRPGLDLVNAVCVDLDTARSSASASRMADRTRLERVPCSVPQVHTWTFLSTSLASTARARVTLSGFDTQGTTAPNEAPCRSRQEATWSPVSWMFRCC